MTEPFFQLQSVACSRGGTLLLEGLSLTITAGSAAILRGPNGIGKTTLLRCVAGLQEFSDGSCKVDPDMVAYAAHSDGLKSTLTVQENLEFWAKMFGTGDVEPALQQMALTDLRDRPAAQLSAGQKRRLGLARLLISDRPLWILDEPTVSLDAEMVALFVNILKSHLADGGSALISTHIDIGISAPIIDLAAYRPARGAKGHSFDEAFL